MENPVVLCFGKQVYLGPILRKHLKSITAWLNDSDIRRFLDLSAPVTSQEIEKSWRSIAERVQNDIVFSICLCDGKEVIGETGLHDVNLIDGSATMGCFIGRKDLWGRGYGTEAQILLLEYAFTTLNLRKVSAEIHDSNIRSKKCLERCGYVRKSYEKQHHHLAVTKKDFLPILGKYKMGEVF